MILRDSSPLASLFLWPRHITLYSGPCQVLVAPFVSRYIFQDGRIGTSTSFAGHSFIHCFVEQVEKPVMFIQSDRVKVLYCFIWNYREPGKIYLLDMTVNLLLCGFRLFNMLYWTRYHTDLEEMLKKKNSSKWTLIVGNFLKSRSSWKDNNKVQWH